MKTKRMKKWGKRIIVGILISLALSIAAPTILSGHIDTTNHTVYAATCKDTGETAAECTPTAPGKCPSGYTEDKTKNICTKQTSTGTTDQGTLNVMKFLIKVQDILNRAIWPVLVMIGGLMDNSLLFGNGMEERLREIWIPIRNIVNILFVIALVAIALYNVLGIGDENSNYSIKAILPKIIIGIIVVNFSFLGIKVFLDGINVLTSAIFALPNQVGAAAVLDPGNDEHADLIDKYCRSMKGRDFNEVLDPVVIKKETEDEVYRRIARSNEYKQFFPDVIATSTKQDILQMMENNEEMFSVDKKEFQDTVDENINNTICTINKDTKKMELTARGLLFLKNWNARNASLAMALGLSKIVLYKEIDINSLKNIDKLVINSALSLILYLLFIASFIALFVVLLGRLVVMWLAIALSPVLLLAMVIPAVKENVSGFGDVTNTFIQNAIAPLGIGLSLSIGWIMLKALQGLNGLYGGEQISFTATEGIPVVGLTTLQDLLVGVGTIAVIWLGVFTAASKTIAAPVTDWMKSGLSRAGQWIGTLPLKHAPIFKIDLPDEIDKGEDTYTGAQVLNAFQRITQPKDEYKLADRLIGKGGAYETSGLKNIKNPNEMYGWLKSNKNTDPERLRNNLTEFKSKNAGIYRKLHPTVQRDINALITSKDKNKYRDLRDKIMSNTLVQKATPRATTPATPAKRHSAQQPTINVANKVKIITSRNELTRALDANATKDKIQPLLKTFLQALPARDIKKGEDIVSKNYLRKDTYDALVGKVGEQFIKNNLPK